MILPGVQTGVLPAIGASAGLVRRRLGGRSILAIVIEGITYAIALEIDDTAYAIAL